MIYVESKRKKIEKIQEKYPNAIILDITSKSPMRSCQMLSPFYPHGNIPVPGIADMKATCVEAVWQGLKVFESSGVDYDTFKNGTMRNLKRTTRRFGMPVGHAYGDRLLNYFDARMLIYLPTYKWVLDNVPEVHKVVERIKEQAQKQEDIVFLDYNTNIDFCDISSPISHAGLVKLYIEGKYPDVSQTYIPVNKKSTKNKKEKTSSPNKKKSKATQKTKQTLSSPKGKQGNLFND